jgi:hypothetical protein
VKTRKFLQNQRLLDSNPHFEQGPDPETEIVFLRIHADLDPKHCPFLWIGGIRRYLLGELSLTENTGKCAEKGENAEPTYSKT